MVWKLNSQRVSAWPDCCLCESSRPACSTVSQTSSSYETGQLRLLLRQSCKLFTGHMGVVAAGSRSMAHIVMLVPSFMFLTDVTSRDFHCYGMTAVSVKTPNQHAARSCWRHVMCEILIPIAL